MLWICEFWVLHWQKSLSMSTKMLDWSVSLIMVSDKNRFPINCLSCKCSKDSIFLISFLRILIWSILFLWTETFNDSPRRRLWGLLPQFWPSPLPRSTSFFHQLPSLWYSKDQISYKGENRYCNPLLTETASSLLRRFKDRNRLGKWRQELILLVVHESLIVFRSSPASSYNPRPLPRAWRRKQYIS